MRLAPLLLLPTLLSGCIPIGAGYLSFYPHTTQRSPEICGTLLDERTKAPVANAEIFLTQHPQVKCRSDAAGRFRIQRTRNWHGGNIAGPAGANPWPAAQYWDPRITISHTNYSPRALDLGWYPDDVILLKKLGERAEPRPWVLLNGGGTIVQDRGAAQYLKPGGICLTEHHTNFAGTRPTKLRLAFARRVYDLKVMEVDGFDQHPLIDCPRRDGLDWEFRTWYPRDDLPTEVKDAARVFRVEFTP